MRVEELNFPVLALRRRSMIVATTRLDLTTCTKTALKNGYFKGLFVIDVLGRKAEVTHARKLSGRGLFWGYNIFLNQKIIVEITLSPSEPMALEAVKHLVESQLIADLRWRYRDDYRQICNNVADAPSVEGLINVIKAIR